MKDVCEKVLISGWYGFGNVGDEAILQAMIDRYSPTKDGSNVRALSFRPRRTMQWQGVPAANQPPQSLKGWAACLLFFRWIRTLRYLLWCDEFVMGGGGFLSDWDRDVPKKWLRQFRWAKILGKKTALDCVGIGPIFADENKKLIKNYAKKYIDRITVRDEDSKKWLVDQCGVSCSRVHVEIDPVANLDCARWRSGDRKKNMVAVIYAKYFDRENLFGDAVSLREALEQCYLAQLQEIKQSGIQPILISFQPDAEREWLNKMGARANVRVYYPDDFKDAIRIISECAAVVSFRLHGNILAYALRMPFLPIIYHHKGFGFLEMAKMEKMPALVVGDGINIPGTTLAPEAWIVETRRFLKERV